MELPGIKEIQTDGRVYVHYPADLRQGVEEAMEAWKAFCALPEEQKLRFPYSADMKTSGNGYELKKEVGNLLDQKEDFHLRVVVRDELMKSAHAVDDTVTPAFVEKALAVNELMVPILRSFGESVEKEFSIPGFADDIMAKQPFWLLRFLHYFGDKKAGDEIAVPHVDKGGFTLHLYESDPGVERLTYDTKEWVEMPLAHDETVIIPGMGLQNRSRCQLRALCHRVVATPDTAVNGRYSAVCFFNFDHVRFFDKARFGRLQDWKPGAFYDMPFEEFDSYFID